MRQIFLDTETTGLSPESGDRMVEIGCIEMDNRRLTGRHLHFYLNPERRNGEGAVAVHGLTDEFLSDKPLFAHVVDEMLEFVSGAEIIIHNASFDVGFLNEELRRCGKPKFSTHVSAITDTLAMARDQFPGKSNSLDALCKRLEVDNSNRTLHGALIDANLLAEVYIRLTRGQDSLVMDMTSRRQPRRRRSGRPDRPFGVRAPRHRRERRRTRRPRARVGRDRQGQRRQDDLACTTARSCGIIQGCPEIRANSYRVVSSAVEHCLHTARVTGSIPVPPTNKYVGKTRACEKIAGSSAAAAARVRRLTQPAARTPAPARRESPPAR